MEEVKEEKKTIDISLPQFKGKDKYETTENYSILFIFIGAVIFSSGIGLSIVYPKGLSAILAMLGGLVAFLSTVALILVWLFKEIFGSE